MDTNTQIQTDEQRILELFVLIKKLVEGKPWRFCKHQETENGRITIYLKIIDKKK